MASGFPIVRQHPSRQRLHIALQGIIQGVGFRPFIYRLAQELTLGGWVQNSAQGVVIEVEGSRSRLDAFLQRLEPEKPPRSVIQHMELTWLDPVGQAGFEIRASALGPKTAIVLPDLATCPDCLAELFTPTNRRYHYPFTNCTHCGPRFSIIEGLPYDRPNTTLKSFQLCPPCQAEYDDPGDRRFHAQPNACPQCGPHLECWDATGQILATHDLALQLTTQAIRQGQIVAVKGLGGFHLIVDARNGTAIQRLRQAKQRPEKAFALMSPSLEWVKTHCAVSVLEEELLRSPEAPIVLLKRRLVSGLPLAPHPLVAPQNRDLGVMLPYTPLHHWLLRELGVPIVATSGNLADEPICTDEQDALQRLGAIADLFLVHNRPIARPIDDSIVRVVMGQPLVLRRARGYAPLPIALPPSPHATGQPPCILAVGAHLKTTIAFSIGSQIFVSQHLGDLATVPAWATFQQAIASFQHLYDLQPTAIACDLHPDYRSTQWAHQMGTQLQIPVIPVQHHYAHILSGMAEHQLTGSVLGIAWDGVGYGLDGTMWGGEWLHITDTTFQRAAHLRPFRLPGGETAIKEPRRSALGLLYALWGDQAFDMTHLAPLQAFSASELRLLQAMLHQTLNSPITSSAGRLFDAIAALLGLHQQTQFEGQAAMSLEFAIAEVHTDAAYPVEILETATGQPSPPLVIDWAAMVQAMVQEIQAGVAIAQLAAKVHNTLVDMMLLVANQVGEERVVLTGGCWQNKYLAERAIQRLKQAGFCPYWQQQIPPNDGGIAVGQIMAADRALSSGKLF